MAEAEMQNAHDLVDVDPEVLTAVASRLDAVAQRLQGIAERNADSAAMTPGGADAVSIAAARSISGRAEQLLTALNVASGHVRDDAATIRRHAVAYTETDASNAAEIQRARS